MEKKSRTAINLALVCLVALAVFGQGVAFAHAAKTGTSFKFSLTASSKSVYADSFSPATMEFRYFFANTGTTTVSFSISDALFSVPFSDSGIPPGGTRTIYFQVTGLTTTTTDTGTITVTDGTSSFTDTVSVRVRVIPWPSK